MYSGTGLPVRMVKGGDDQKRENGPKRRITIVWAVGFFSFFLWSFLLTNQIFLDYI
jgi:hypothetical protein